MTNVYGSIACINHYTVVEILIVDHCYWRTVTARNILSTYLFRYGYLILIRQSSLAIIMGDFYTIELT